MRINEYEAMFLLENNAATADFEGTSGQVDAILEKHGAEIVQKEKWDERKLAYEIKGHRRATYYLVYFRVDPANINEINVDLGLNEIVIRHMFIRLDEPMQEHIDTLAAERELLAEDSRKHSLSGWGRRDRRSDRRSSGPRDGDGDGEARPQRDAATKAPEGEGKAEGEKPAEGAEKADAPAAAVNAGSEEGAQS